MPSIRNWIITKKVVSYPDVQFLEVLLDFVQVQFFELVVLLELFEVLFHGLLGLVRVHQRLQSFLLFFKLGTFPVHSLSFVNSRLVAAKNVLLFNRITEMWCM